MALGGVASGFAVSYPLALSVNPNTVIITPLSTDTHVDVDQRNVSQWNVPHSYVAW